MTDTQKKDSRIFAVRLDGQEYTLEKLTLGDLHYMGEKHGCRDLEDIYQRMTDPQVWVGLIILAYHRANPNLTRRQAEQAVEAIDLAELEPLAKPPTNEEAQEVADDPTPAATGGEGDVPAASPTGTSETIPASSGEQT